MKLRIGKLGASVKETLGGFRAYHLSRCLTVEFESVLLDSTIGKEQEARASYDLSDALDWIKTLAPSLANRPTFRSLSTTARRQG